MIELPGLIDPHVHLREPGGTHKEDFDTGTAAALAGGFTQVLAMPNTKPALIDATSFELAKRAAQSKARCDFGLFVGAGADNAASVAELASSACGLKVYMDQTYGPLRMRSLPALTEHFKSGLSHLPIAIHAEGRSLAIVLALAHLYDRRIHICHVSQAIEVQLIRKAKERGLRVTCEVTPHHLLLSELDAAALGAGMSEVRPRLASTSDVAALWDSLDVVDCFATDHAPHTVAEKEGTDPPPGFPGLETAVALFLNAIHDGRLTVDDLVTRMYSNPRRIFRLSQQPETAIEIDTEAAWEVKGDELQSRCGWSPFEGMRLKGRVRRVVLRGQLAYEDGQVLAPAGSGRDVVSELLPA